jgi:PAS domain S-box-containing protein
MEQIGQIESRPYGPAKVFTLAERIPLDNPVSLLPHMILVLSESLTILQVNNAFLKFFSLDKTDLIGREIRFSPLGSYMNESRFALLQKALEGTPRFIEEDITLEGNTFYFNIRILPTLFENGGKGIALIFEDITTLKITQNHLEELVHERTTELEKVNKKLCDEIVKHRTVRKKLEFSQHEYEQLVENSTDLIVKFSSAGNLIYFNPLAGQVLDIDPTKIQEYSLWDLCIPDSSLHHDSARSLLSDLIANPGSICKREIEYTRPEKPLWISWTFRSIPSESSSPPDILGIGNEITDRILSEKRLIESEHHLSDILTHLPDPTFVIDSQRRVVIWNQAMEMMSGVPAPEVIGKKRSFFTPSIFGYSRPILADFIFDPENAENELFFHNLTREDGALTAETKGIDIEGKEIIFWVKATALKDITGQIVGAIQSMRDITSIRTLENSLIQSEGMIRGLLNASKDLVVVLDQEKRYRFVNSAFMKFFPCSNKDLTGISITEHPLPGENQEWHRNLDPIIRTRLSNRFEIPVTYNSRDLVLDCYAIPFYLPHSDTIHILLDIRDVTRMKGKEDTLWEDETILQEIGKQVSRLIPAI